MGWTDLVIGSVPTSRAGSAAAINETAFEFGGALGVAVLGTLQARASAEELAGSSTAQAIVAGGVILGMAVVISRGVASERGQGSHQRGKAAPSS